MTTRVVLIAIALGLWAAPTAAHAVIQPATASAGAIEIPDEVEVAEVVPAEGVDVGRSEGEITWSGGSLAHGDVEDADSAAPAPVVAVGDDAGDAGGLTWLIAAMAGVLAAVGGGTATRRRRDDHTPGGDR